MMKNYSELIRFSTFEDRFNYLSFSARVGDSTFGSERFLNQMLYKTKEWKRIRQSIILRDEACDLGIPERELFDYITIHHIDPITIDDIEECNPKIFDPSNLICCSADTHRAIHFGDISNVTYQHVERRKGDTTLW